jgi:hypothetical protein
MTKLWRAADLLASALNFKNPHTSHHDVIEYFTAEMTLRGEKSNTLGVSRIKHAAVM